MMRDNETIYEWAAREKKKDEAIGVAAVLFAFFILSGVIGLVVQLR